MKVIDRTKAVTQHFLENSFKKLSIKRKEKSEKHKNIVCLLRHDVVRVFCAVPCVSFCTGHFVMVPLNMTYLHYLQHSLFEQFSIYIVNRVLRDMSVYMTPDIPFLNSHQ